MEDTYTQMFVIAFLPRSKRLLISWLQSLSTVILKPKKTVCHCFQFFPLYLPWSDVTRCHELRVFFLILSFKPAFSLSSFTLIKRLFSFSILSAIRVVSSAHLRLLFLPAMLIPTWDSSILVFRMLYPAYRLYKQGDNIQPYCTPFPIWTSLLFHVWFKLLLLDPHIGFSVVWYSHLFKNFPQLVIHTVKGFSLVSEAEISFFLEFPCFLHDLMNVGNLISGSSAFSKPSLYI